MVSEARVWLIVKLEVPFAAGFWRCSLLPEFSTYSILRLTGKLLPHNATHGKEIQTNKNKRLDHNEVNSTCFVALRLDH